MAAEKLETEIRQDQITTAAFGLIAAKGVAEFSMARLADRVGLVPSAIYRHFKSKDEVLEATISHVRKRLMENARMARNATPDPVDCLHNLLKLHTELVRRNRGILHIVFSDSVYSRRPRRKQRMYQAVAAYLNQVAEVIADGQARGLICQDADAHTLSVMFLGLIQPAAFLSHMSDGAFDVSEHAEKAWEVFHRCLTGSQGS
jgi:AcrR family transcriptional regulator